MSERILVINPNSTEAVTREIDRALDGLRFAGGPRIDCATLTEGPPGVESQLHVDSVAAPMCALAEREAARTEAYVVACFSDPGLYALRERLAQPVFGIAACAYAAALTLGERFGTISILEASVARHMRYVAALGIAARCAGDRPVGLGVTELKHGETVFRRLCQVGEALKGDGADVVILGCTGMAQYRDAVEQALGVPVLDPTQTAVAAAIGRLRARAATASPRAASGSG